MTTKFELAVHLKSFGIQKGDFTTASITLTKRLTATLKNRLGEYCVTIISRATNQRREFSFFNYVTILKYTIYISDKNFKIHLVPIPLSGRPSASPFFDHLRDFYRSDHYNFWENSVTFPAVMVTDTSNFRAKMDKCYHKKCDGMRLIDKRDMEFLRRNINAVIGATLELSEIGRFVMVVCVCYGMVYGVVR